MRDIYVGLGDGKIVSVSDFVKKDGTNREREDDDFPPYFDASRREAIREALNKIREFERRLANAPRLTYEILQRRVTR